MINEREVMAVFDSDISVLAAGYTGINSCNKPFYAIECLTEYTKELIRDHRNVEAIACFNTAGKLLHQGSKFTRLAMVNIFIHSVSRLLEYSCRAELELRYEFLRYFGKEYNELIYAKNP